MPKFIDKKALFNANTCSHDEYCKASPCRMAQRLWEITSLPGPTTWWFRSCCLSDGTLCSFCRFSNSKLSIWAPTKCSVYAIRLNSPSQFDIPTASEWKIGLDAWGVSRLKSVLWCPHSMDYLTYDLWDLRYLQLTCTNFTFSKQGFFPQIYLRAIPPPVHWVKSDWTDAHFRFDGAFHRECNPKSKNNALGAPSCENENRGQYKASTKIELVTWPK